MSQLRNSVYLDKTPLTFVGGRIYIHTLSEIAEIFHAWELDGVEPESFHVTRWNVFADFYLTPM